MEKIRQHGHKTVDYLDKSYIMIGDGFKIEVTVCVTTNNHRSLNQRRYYVQDVFYNITDATAFLQKQYGM
jgi:predicted nuclease of restriction endonuclease-like (RecB) superfamily